MNSFARLRTLPIVLLSFAACLLEASNLSAQTVRRLPARPGYVYPAGGRRGTTFEVCVAGRLISRTTGAVFSGEGVSAKVVDTVWAFRNQDQRDRYRIRNRIGELVSGHVSESPEGLLMKELLTKLPKVAKPPDPPEEIEAIPFVWPRLAALRKIFEPDALVSYDEALEIVYRTYGPGVWRRPPDPLQEIVVLEVSVAPDAEPGDREIRLLTNQGLTHPLYFQVGVHPEVMEREPNNPEIQGLAQFLGRFPRPVYETPVVVNGQILHSDVDRFSFRARQGETLILHAQARQIMPYLADAVPGWFEAVVTVYDDKDRELAFADGFRFEADPVLVFTPPADGVYTAEIRDSLFRGREDFVYRLSIAPTPIVESVFPLGLREGSSTTLRLDGINLPAREIEVDAVPGPEHIRKITRLGDQWLPFPILYEVDSLPEVVAAPDNHSRETAQALTPPTIVNGAISVPGQYDFYRFDGKKGETVVLEITARRLNSPLDSRLLLLDAEGRAIASNDDGGTIDPDRNYVSALFGTQTHNADAKIMTELPATGTFFVRVGDTIRQGGKGYAYRLRISPPRPDFVVYTTPSAQTLFAGNCNPVLFQVERRENYTGPIELRIVDDGRGFRLDGGLIQDGETGVVCTLTSPRVPLRTPVPLRFEAVAVEGGRTTRRPVLAVEDMEQAFLYHHWVPAANFWGFPTQNRSTGNRVRPLESDRILLTPGQSVDVEYRLNSPFPSTAVFNLKDAPPGIRVRKKSQEGKKLVLTFAAAEDTLQKAAEKEAAEAKTRLAAASESSETNAGAEHKTEPAVAPKPYLAGNLLVVVDAETTPKDPKQKKRYQIGTLPAMPFRLEPAPPEN